MARPRRCWAGSPTTGCCSRWRAGDWWGSARADFDSLRLNYAQHAVGAQGRTVDRVYGLFGGWSTDRESGYVSTTRCREVAELFCDADTLAVETERPVPGGASRPPVEAVPEDEWHAAAREVLATRYETSRPKLAALELLAPGREPERTVELDQAVQQEPRQEAVRSNAHAPASERQREYVAALGGELHDRATWVEASMAIDRLRGEPEGEHAARLLLGDGQPAERVAEELELAAGRRGAIELPPVPAEERRPEPEPDRAAPEATVAMEPAVAADRAGHLDRTEVEAGLLRDRDGAVSRSEEPNPPDRSPERALEAPVSAEREERPGTTVDGGPSGDLEMDEERAATRGLRALEEERPHREAEEQARRERERAATEEAQRRALQQEQERHREMGRELERDMGMDLEM